MNNPEFKPQVTPVIRRKVTRKITRAVPISGQAAPSAGAVPITGPTAANPDVSPATQTIGQDQLNIFAKPGPQQGAQQEPKQGPQVVSDPGKSSLLALLKIEAEARKASSEKELTFLISNEMRKLVRARQVFVISRSIAGAWIVKAVSSVDAVNRETPLIRWIERIVQRLDKETGLNDKNEFSLPEYCNEKDSETKSYPFRNMLWIPLKLADGNVFGGMLLARELAWVESDNLIGARLSGTFAHAWSALSGKKKLRRRWAKPSYVAAGGAVLLALAAFIPVSMTALAPAEITAADAFIVASPIDGVIDKVLVEPNAAVVKGQPLIHFVDTEQRNRVELAEREMRVAESKLKRFSQAAFHDPEAKRELRTSMSELGLKRADWDYARDLMKKSVVTAQVAGLAVFADEKDWAGRPVSVGERVMQIADPAKIEVKVELPVNDAIVLNEKGTIKLFLNSEPLKPRNGEIISANHEARLTSSNVLAYTVTAKLDAKGPPPRLGSRGTAQLYGNEVPLYLYLLRRPISALRQHLGW